MHVYERPAKQHHGSIPDSCSRQYPLQKGASGQYPLKNAEGGPNLTVQGRVIVT
jgi:hypothetical protein